MLMHVQKTVSCCFAALCQLRQIRRYVPTSTFQKLVVALVHSRLDYGNGVLVGIPAHLMRRLQSVLNAAARLITGSAVALHCCKAHAKINGKIENSTPCKIVTYEDFNLKLGTRDYVAESTHHATLGSNRPSGGFPPNRGNITPV